MDEIDNEGDDKDRIGVEEESDVMRKITM